MQTLVKPLGFNFRVITANFPDVQIFRIFTLFQLNPSVAVPRERTLIEEEEEGEEVEGLGQAETYSDYMPAKCELLLFFDVSKQCRP